MSDKTSLELFRSINKSDERFPDGPIVNGAAVVGVLYPDFTPRSLPRGGARPADVETFVDSKGATQVRSGKGTSLFDKPHVLPGGAKYWHSFKIPKDTVIPDSLLVRKTGRNEKFGADHWQIEVRTGSMEIESMKGALDNLARNAVVRLIELGEVKATETT